MTKKKNSIPGSIRPQGNNTYQIRFCLGKDRDTGKYNRPQYTFQATPGLPEKEQEKEAEIERARLWVQLTGSALPPVLMDVTLADFIITKWLPNYVLLELKNSTYAWYESLSRIHIIPEIGSTKIKNVSAKQILEMFVRIQKIPNKQTGDIASIYTIRDLFICFNSLFEYAVTMGYIEANPMKDPKKGIKKFTRRINARVKLKAKKARKVYNIDQAIALLTFSRKRREETKWPTKNPVRDLWSGYSHLVYLLALTNGFRRGEIAGLKWDKVVLERKSIKIERTIGEETDEEDIESGEGGDTKSETSTRELLLADFTVEEFYIVKQLQEELKAAAGTFYKDNGWVFANMIGDPLYPSTFTHNFHKDRIKIDLPRIQFHFLRHTAGTLLYQYFKIPLDIISLMLGHSSLGFTRDTYLHPTTEIFRPGIDLVNQELARRFKKELAPTSNQTNSSTNNQSNEIVRAGQETQIGIRKYKIKKAAPRLEKLSNILPQPMPQKFEKDRKSFEKF